MNVHSIVLEIPLSYLTEHPDEGKRYFAGEKKLQGVLVGFVMKKSSGKADPKKVNQLLASRAGAG